MNRKSAIQSRHAEHSDIRRFFNCAAQVKNHKQWTIVAFDKSDLILRKLAFWWQFGMHWKKRAVLNISQASHEVVNLIWKAYIQ